MDALAGAIAGIVVVLFLTRLTLQIGRLERKVDALVKHAGLDMAAVATEKVAELVRAGKKIEAIQLYREYTGCGVAEAKAKVESLA